MPNDGSGRSAQSRRELLGRGGGAGLSSQEAALLGVFAYEGRHLVSVEDVLDVLPVSRPAANQILSRLCRKGWLRRVQRGVYADVPVGAVLEHTWPLAMKLFAPCYISGSSAAEHWRLTQRAHDSVVVVTSRPQRGAEQSHGGVAFRTRSVRRSRIFGTRTVELDGSFVEVADPERLLVDILDDPALGGGIRDTLDIVRAYADRASGDADRLLGYAKRVGRPAVLKRLGFLADVLELASPRWLAECERNVGKGISKLDPHGKAHGAVIGRWQLRVNVPMARVLGR